MSSSKTLRPHHLLGCTSNTHSSGPTRDSIAKRQIERIDIDLGGVTPNQHRTVCKQGSVPSIVRWLNQGCEASLLLFIRRGYPLHLLCGKPVSLLQAGHHLLPQTCWMSLNSCAPCLQQTTCSCMRACARLNQGSQTRKTWQDQANFSNIFENLRSYIAHPWAPRGGTENLIATKNKVARSENEHDCMLAVRQTNMIIPRLWGKQTRTPPNKKNIYPLASSGNSV